MAKAPTTTAKARPTARAAGSTKELGFSDILYVSALSGALDDELFPQMYGLELKRELWKFSLRDETFGAMQWCINSTLAQVAWKHVPQVDGIDNDKDPQALAEAAFADSLLIDMNHTMQDHVEEAMSMVIFGFAACEIVLKQRDGVNSRFNDKLYGIAKLPLRDQMGITTWLYEGNDAVAFKQSSYRGSATIPLWKTLLYRTTSRLDRPEGRPMMLSALRSWRLKEKIQDSEAIGIERDLCGLPTFRVPEEVLEASREQNTDGTPTRDALVAQGKLQSAIKAVRDLRFNQSGGLILPSDTFFEDTSEAGGPGDRTPKWDFKLITTAGQRSIDTRTAARDYDRAIARIMMMQFLHLGDRSGGSYALSDDQSSLAVGSLMALAMKVAAEWNAKVIKLVWTVNSKDPKYMPRMRASDISKDGLQAIGQLLQGIGRATGLWEGDADMRMQLAELAGLTADRTSQASLADAALKLAENPVPAPTFGAKPGGGNNPPDPNADPKETL